MNNHTFIEKTADQLENVLSDTIKNSRLEAPLIDNTADMESHKWYRLLLPEGRSGDGTEYHIYIKKGADAGSGPLCLFFSGGGIAYDAKTAKSPATAGRVLTGDGGYYWNNLRPITQIMNIGAGITDLNKHKNPFYDWNFIIITYSTGDFHVGDSEYGFIDSEGVQNTLYYHGYKNYIEAIKESVGIFPDPERLLIAGDSAGGFAVLALANDICNNWYNKCSRVTVFSDSSFLEKDDWSYTISELWNAPEGILGDIKGLSLSTEWYRYLYDAFGDKIQYLFACSPRDYLLSSFRNEINKGEFRTDKEIQREYREACKKMLVDLRHINPKTGIFTYNWKNMIYPGGGTIHTAVRTPFFYVPNMKKIAMSKWLYSNLM